MSAHPTGTVLEQPAQTMRAPDIPPPPGALRKPIARAGLRYWTVFGSHVLVDLFPIFLFTLGPALTARISLTPGQYAAYFALGPIVSGVSQPLFSWISDRYNTRLLGPAGLALASVCVCSVGFVENFWQLVALQIVGMTGVGVYHPIGSAVAGRLSRDAMTRFGSPRRARGLGLSIFFTGGMLGQTISPFIASRINITLGMEWLLLVAAPSLVMAWLLWIATRRVPHRALKPVVVDPLADAQTDRAPTSRQWRTVWLLLVINSCRFTTNIGLFFLFTQWAMARLGAGDDATALSAKLIGASTFGMAVGGLASGWVITAGREKTPFILLGFASAPLIALMPWMGFWPILISALVVAVGYFMPVPASIGLAQRILPHATGTTGAMLMGCGWTISALGPLGAGWIIAGDNTRAIQQALGLSGIELGFIAIALVMAASSLLSLFLPRDLLESSAHLEDHHD